MNNKKFLDDFVVKINVLLYKEIVSFLLDGKGPITSFLY